MRVSITIAPLALAFVGCGALLDFDDLEDLPCPCDVDFVCLTSSNVCKPRNSVDLGKSCNIDTDGLGDELCPAGARCQAVNDQGPRCLKTCTPVVPATPESSVRLAQECAPQQYCFGTPRGGVCSEGICSDQTNLCTGLNQQCVFLNGAGVCFTACRIYDSNPPPCGAAQVCHPVGDSRVTACLPSGNRLLYEPCSATELCSNKDALSGRPMVCDRPMGSQDLRRCHPICNLQNPCFSPEQCLLARPQIDTVQNLDLNICVLP